MSVVLHQSDCLPPLLSEHKVIIVGLDNAGKTTILYQFLMNEVVHTSPTIGSNVEEIVVKNTHFLMWDIGGQESLRSLWNTYYSNTEAAGSNSMGHVQPADRVFETPALTGCGRIYSYARTEFRPSCSRWHKVMAPCLHLHQVFRCIK
uniref:ADP ribosylation factor like GTPase 5B n=1 Tax=Pelusios castaneus TaxID=367368 RepID=A0A8C8RLQ5_9SAUR